MWVLLRSVARRRWRSWVVVALLIGSLSGLAMAAAAGARRTNTVVDRARAAQGAADIYMVPHYTPNGELLDFAKIAAFPEVVDAIRTPTAHLKEVGDGRGFDSPVSVLGSGYQPRVVSGHLPRRANEVAVNLLARDAWGLELGQRLRVRFATPDEIDGEVGPSGITTSLRITAFASAIGDFGGDAEPSILVSPVFWEAHKDGIGQVELFMMRLAHGADDYAAFHEHIDELVGGQSVFYLEASALNDQIQRSFALQATALGILAAFLGITALLIGSQLLVRLVRFEASDDATLRALGVGSGPLAGAGIARALLIAAVATATAVSLAFGLSRLFPLGDPGLAEPFPGPRGDAAVFVAGAVIVTVVLVLVTLVCLRRRERRGPARASGLAALLAQTLPGPGSAVGARLALERGAARTTVPVRSTFATAVLGVAAFVIALSVGASLTRLLVTPKLYGWDWDVVITGFEQRDIDAAALASVPGVDSYSIGITGEGGQVLVNGREAAATALGRDGGVTPPVLDGRVPVAANEVALAARTYRQASAKIGDDVRMRFPGIGRSATFRVVGVVVLPFTGDSTSLGEGVFITMDGARRMYPDVPSDSAFVRFAPNANARAVVAELRRALPEHEVSGPRTPTTLLDFGNVQNFPLVIAGVVGLLAAGTVLHLLTSSIRAARRDLAIVKTIGASQRQLRGIVAWQSSIVVAIAMLVGAPLGLVAGRWMWILLARTYGFVAAPALPLAALVAVAAAGLLFANLVALMPARAAARTPVALVLRSE